MADVTPAGLLRLAGDALDGRYAGHLRAYRPGPATLKVDWALSGPIPWSAAEARSAGTVHVGGAARRGARGAGADRRAACTSARSCCSASSRSRTRRRAPAGQHTAWAYTHGPLEADWAAETDRHVERMEAQVERFAPGFRDRILARHVLGPAELERADANLAGGDVGAGSYELDQVVFRPVPDPVALPHARARAVHRQRGDLPRRRRPRRARLRGGAGRAARAAPAPRLRAFVRSASRPLRACSRV